MLDVPYHSSNSELVGGPQCWCNAVVKMTGPSCLQVTIFFLHTGKLLTGKDMTMNGQSYEGH